MMIIGCIRFISFILRCYQLKTHIYTKGVHCCIYDCIMILSGIDGITID